jgi:hypothetical protein
MDLHGPLQGQLCLLLYIVNSKHTEMVFYGTDFWNRNIPILFRLNASYNAENVSEIIQALFIRLYKNVAYARFNLQWKNMNHGLCCHAIQCDCRQVLD